MNKKYDNFNIIDLPIILNEETTLKRYWDLIPYTSKIINKLVTNRITTKYEYLSSNINLCDYDIPEDIVNKFNTFLHLHDFIERDLKEINVVDSVLIQGLIEKKIKKSDQYMMLYEQTSPEFISNTYNCTKEEVIKLYHICNLMRLPGVKSLRANLYYECGYVSLEDFTKTNALTIQAHINRIIEEQKKAEIVPLYKEVMTHIAVAKLFTSIESKDNYE